ncbi:histone-lysine N-methyltransferase 2A-like isoform X2 [Styela clava]
MSTAAKGRFPGCPRRKIEKRRIINLNHRHQSIRWENHLSIAEQIKKNLRRFYEMFGNSDEDEDFHGFSSEECGLRAYKRINGSGRGSAQIPDILGSPIDLTKKKVTTRLAHARNSLDSLPSSERTRRRKRTIIRRRYSKSEVPIIEGNDVPSEPLVRVTSSESEYTLSSDQGFTKYKNSNLDFHCLSESVGFGIPSSTAHMKNPVSKSNKTSPIKPATFIAPSLSYHMHQVTNVTPTCLKIKLNQDEENGPGHPKVLAKALLARANKRGRKLKQSSVEFDEPMYTSTPIITSASKSKSKSFVLPTKSSRSSRIIKANRRYVDSDDANTNVEIKDTSAVYSNSVHELQHQDSHNESSKTKADASHESPSKGRPLLKEATFRVAALANINNKPQPTRSLDKGISTRIRARKLIKRARFKHPTSSSTLVVGNDYDDENRLKRNLIREATFKPPNYSQRHSSSSECEKDQISDLGLSRKEWHKIIQNDTRYESNVPLWTKQEIHNVLHGANTFFNSWTTIARHYRFDSSHRDWLSMKNKSKALTTIGLLSGSLKVKSSILLQLRPQLSDNPNVTAFTARELRMRGMKSNVECDIGEGGRVTAYQLVNDDGNTTISMTEAFSRNKKASLSTLRKRFEKWKQLVPKEPPDPQSVYLGLTPDVFRLMCHVKRGSKFVVWSTEEIHNLLHGIHIFGHGEWTKIHSNYKFHPSHDNLQLRCRYKSVACRDLVIAGKVKEDILPFLRPVYSEHGKKLFGITLQKQRKSPNKPCGKNKTTENNKNEINKRKARSRKRSKSSDTDLTSPPRKQAYHLFGTAPVWDDSSAGLQSLSGNSDVEETPALEIISSPTEEMGKKGDRGRKSSNESSTKKKKEPQDVALQNKKSNGPRIKHVCRRASLVTGHKPATYNDDSVNPQLSALPRKEREKIAAEQGKIRDTQNRELLSSDSDNEAKGSPIKLSARKKDKGVRCVTTHPEKFVKRKNDNKKRCNSCKNCRSRKCGTCENCKNSTNDNICLRRPPCLYPPDNTNLTMKELRKKYNFPTRLPTKPSPDIEKISKYETEAQKSHQKSVTSGIILSPDSRHRLQQELHERDQQQLASIVKIDEWKERYELEDLWNMGGVSIITSRTPSTKIVCFLCGSVGKTRPLRRISSTSDSSACSDLMTPIPLFIFCVSCCEPFHSFCLDDHEQQGAINDAKRGIWICKRCKSCNVCGRPNDLLECKRCNKTYHSQCLGPSYPTKPSKNRVWVCMRCVRCRSCGASRPGRRPGSKWTHDFQLCQRCGDLFDKGNFCPICRRCYRDEDYETRMIQCGTCKRWVHSRCESLTIEMYTLLSHLPDDVQYTCPDCDGRKNKVELELSLSDNVLTDDSGNDSLEGDKMRCLLCKLPPPSWKKRIEGEIQSGIENVMMALFHSKDAACILKKSAVHDTEDESRPVDLFTVRFAVHNRRYNSVAHFSSDVCFILNTVHNEDIMDTEQQVNDASSKKWKRKRYNVGARGAFIQEMHNVFPWFDVETGRVRDSSDVPEDLLPHATLPPHNDHNYAQWQDRDIDLVLGGPDTPMKNPLVNDSPTKSENIGTVIWAQSPQKQYEDMRQCLFCGKYGDDHPTNAGRLLYCGQDEWVHVNCALWSAEVFERHDGSLQNVYSAVSRGKMMKCEFCKLPGATVGCNTRDCPQNFHFSCAKLAQCTFQEDKKVFCARHVRNVDGEIVPEERFEVARRVVVDNDEMRPNKRWQRGMMSQDITILLGSAIIHQLGRLSPSSDSKDYLIPVHFRMTRMFWSTVHAGHRVRYTITVTEQKSPYDGPAVIGGFGSASSGKVESHGNRTISHAQDDTTQFPVSKKSPKKPRYPAVDSCRSNLIDRMQSTHAPLHRRKSHEHPAVEPEVMRSRRFSGSSYTVIGSVNRTLPQAITPLPTISRSSTTYQRMLPALQESSFHEDNSKKVSFKEKDRKIPEISVDEKILQRQNNKNLALEIENAIVVSHQNPFLNLNPVSEIENKNDATKLMNLTLPSENANTCISNEKLPISSNQNTEAMPSAISTAINQENVIKEVDIEDLSFVKSDCQEYIKLSTPYAENPLSKVTPPKTDMNMGKSLLFIQPVVSPEPFIETNAYFQTAQLSVSQVPLLSTLASSVANSNIAKKFLLGSSGSVMCSGLKNKQDSAIENDILKSNISMDKHSFDSVTDLQKSDHEIPNTSRVIISVPCKESQTVLSVCETSIAKDIAKSCTLDPSKPISEISVSTNSTSSVALTSSCGDACKTKSVISLKNLATTVTTESNVSTELRVSVERLNSTTDHDKPTTVNLLKEAKNALENEFIDVSMSEHAEQSITSTNLWWKKTVPDKKVVKKVKKSNAFKDDSEYSPEQSGKNKNFKRKFQRSSSDEEDVGTRVRTRSQKSVSDSNKTKELNTSKDSVVTEVRNGNSEEEIVSCNLNSVGNDMNEEDSRSEMVEEKKSDEKSDMNHTEIEDFNSTENHTEINETEEKSATKSEDSVNSDILNSTKSDVSNSQSNSPNTSINSESSFSSESSKETRTRLRSLRKFAKETDGQKSEPSKIQNFIKKQVKVINDHSDDNRRKTRSFSHDSSLFLESTEIVCNGINQATITDTEKQSVSSKEERSRSKSADNSKKKKQVAEKGKSTSENMDITPSRYPRRNPFTCLKSFSGLSPNYAIQSYSLKSSGRKNRADARSIKSAQNQSKKNKSKVTKNKNKMNTSNDSVADEHVIDDIAELVPIVRSKRRKNGGDKKKNSSANSSSNDLENSTTSNESFSSENSAEKNDVALESEFVVSKDADNIPNNDKSVSSVDASAELEKDSSDILYTEKNTGSSNDNVTKSSMAIEEESLLAKSPVCDEKSNTVNIDKSDIGSQDTCNELSKIDVMPVEDVSSNSNPKSCDTIENCSIVNHPSPKEDNCVVDEKKVQSSSNNEEDIGTKVQTRSQKSVSDSNTTKDTTLKDSMVTEVRNGNSENTIENCSIINYPSPKDGNCVVVEKVLTSSLKSDVKISSNTTDSSSQFPITSITSKEAEIALNENRAEKAISNSVFDPEDSSLLNNELLIEKNACIVNMDGQNDTNNLASANECISKHIDLDEEQTQHTENVMDTSNASVSSIDDSIEIIRGIIGNETNQTAKQVLPQPDIVQQADKSVKQQTQLTTGSGISSPLLTHNLQMHEGSLVPSINHLPYSNTNDKEDLESPLSPRDEPRLSLPIETNDAASFLVTSECPVLNADEVQSLLEMPPSVTTATCPSLPQTAAALQQAIPTPTIIQSQVANSMYMQPQQYIQVENKQQSSYTYIPENVTLVPFNFNPATPLVVYNQPCSPTFIQQPVNIRTLPVQYGQSLIVSPPSAKGQYSFDMRYCSPVMPIVMQPAGQQATFVSSPVMNSNISVGMLPNTNGPQFSVKNNTARTHMRPPGTGKIIPYQQSSQHASTKSVFTKDKVKAPTKPKPPSPPTVTQPCLTNDVKLDAEQRKVLERMIEFYSNKNKLSDQEKQIVRAIIAQQIQNKKLPMPTLDTQQNSPSKQPSNHKFDQKSPPNILQDSSKHSVPQGIKRKHSPTELCHPIQKRIKKTKRKEKHVPKSDQYSKDHMVKNKQYDGTPQGLCSSPLLDVYMKVVDAERISDDKAVKKLRDVVQTLSRRRVHLHVPWSSRKGKENRLPPPPQSLKRSHLIYEIKSEDGYHAQGTDLQELVTSLLDSVQECRANAYVRSPSLCLTSIISPSAFLGVSHDAVRFLVEQLPGARHCLKYRAKYYKHREPPAEVVTHINPHGCARAEKFQGRSKPDMFSFLASKHRLPPSYEPSRTQNVDMQQNSTRRPTSMDLPMAMRFRHLRTSAREAVGVYRSAIHGRGLYCKRDIEAGEMVMEYTGEVIRCFLTDHREKMYETKGIGCYMFRMDDMYVVDATMMGSGARFINHSCEPSCYSRIVHIDGKKHIIIFALRKILRGEELTYDYKFPIEADDQKIMCNCGAKTCRKYMN